ncbi:permease-like cell division protein FtsX [Tessaracoccus sp. OS52]|uniref:permease-like cell division protein FtsX n=1 Tax=Tessaracoccus sp. OS52 TaxID=2886691 RepID=UPI001D0FF1F6|nr:permease-like cell division protein FtsX [Tessaracoccus sp. OS52]MCC2592776.1 permease-like cell division protein FtsX [Tessaracoccus sp. OS52]
MRHTLRETWSGLRRNLAMTIAVIVTMGVSLSLFGAGLLTSMEVDLVKGRWYDRIEISVFLCTEHTQGGMCEEGKATTAAQRESIRQTLEANPEVAEVFYESKEAAFEEFQRVFADSPILGSRTVDQMQDSFRLKLENPENYSGVVSEAQGLQGVQNVQDLHRVLDPMFSWLNALQWATIGMSVLLLLAASLQIANTIRMAAFTRRREIGIMRLVGASNFYIVLPFLLESLIAGLIGVLAASVTLATGYYLVIERNAKTSIQALPWIDWSHVTTAILAMTAVGIALAIIPTLLATRKYLRI